MSPRRSSRKRNVEEGPEAVVTLTPNQVVAHNLTRARELRVFTQDQAAAALEPYLGVRWSRATMSQAERSVAGKFVRNFDADELVAFCRAFELPLGWFFLPPPPEASPGVPVALATADGRPFGMPLATLVDLVFGTAEQQGLLALRLDAFLDQLEAGRLSEAQARVRGLVASRVESLVRHSFRQLGQWQTSLRSLANQLEDLEARAERSVRDELVSEDDRREGGHS